MSEPSPPSTRERLLAAAIGLVRVHGYAATGVEEICRAAGVTKGAFFHHFASKEALGVAAAQAWSAHAETVFAAAAYQNETDPLARVLGYLDARRAMIEGPPEGFSCFAGTVLQETFASSEALRAACGACVTDHAASLEPDFTALIARYGAPEGVTALSLALHSQAVLQGAFILAKATADPACARDSIDHLRRYVCLLFAGAGEGDPS